MVHGTSLFNRFVVAVLAWFFLMCASRDVFAQSKDGLCRKIHLDAMSDNFERRDFEGAQRKVEQALRICGEKSCSNPVRAQLYVSLGRIRWATNEKTEPTEDLFVQALRLSKEARLPADVDPALLRLFERARLRVEQRSEVDLPFVLSNPFQSSRLSTSAAPVLTPGPEADRPPSSRAASSLAGPLNSVQLWVAPDFELLSASNACGPGSPEGFVCLDEQHQRYSGYPQRSLDNNNVKGGFASSTVRLMVAYRRMLTRAIAAEGRLGWAFRGAPDISGVSAFFPIHAEARVAYYFGRIASLRPYAFVSGGAMEIATHANVLVVEVPCSVDLSSGCSRKLGLWHRTGRFFGSAGAGLEYAVTRQHSALLGLRANLTFPRTAFVLSPELGYSFSF